VAAKVDEVIRKFTPLVAILTLLGVLLGTGAATAAPAPVRVPVLSGPRVLVYGDSLVHEAAPYARDLLANVARVDARVIGAPGASLCDLLPQMYRDAQQFRPTMVVIDFSGNAFGPCMKHADGSDLDKTEWLAKYKADTIEAIRIFRNGSPQIWLGTAPIALVPEKKGDMDVYHLAAMEHALARDNPRVHVTEAGSAVLDHGSWTHDLRCLPKEPCQGGFKPDLNNVRVDGVNIVRAPDGAHFCPVPYPQLEDCPVYASGGLRYAAGLLYPGLAAQGLLDPGRYNNSIFAGFAP
jgi:hypothetical protein